jgi:hypothetical protein
MNTFSDRFGYKGADAPITVREDAPEALRVAVVQLGYEAGMGPDSLRSSLCEVLLKRPDRNNWSPSNIEGEVERLIDDAPWYKVYDVAEKLYGELKSREPWGTAADTYEQRLNMFFREHGIGWEMKEGSIVARGSEAFAVASRTAVDEMKACGRTTAANEIHEALNDISRRPHADVTGAIQHAMAALECVAREVSGSTETLGKIVPKLGLPKPLDSALEKLWGFASEQGRHIREGRDPRFEDAELIVTVACAVSAYLIKAPQVP